MISALIDAEIFDGNRQLSHYALIIDGPTIRDLAPAAHLPDDIEQVISLKDHSIVPGYIDLQINGGGGVLFNDAPTVDSIRTMGNAHARFGTTGYLPTLVTDSFEVMAAAMTSVKEAMTSNIPGVLGIHLEGPFLNPAKRGIHDASKMYRLDDEAVEMVLSLSQGVTLLTLAPEMTTPEMIERLSKAGVIVSIGHTEATYEQVQDALAAGATGFTHLYNAMTPVHSREPGVVGAALEHDESWFGIIADGHHVHPATFNLAVRTKKRGGAVLVTDAMPSVGSNCKAFKLHEEEIEVVDGRCITTNGVLAGSDLNMATAVRNAARFSPIGWQEAVRMASRYPAKALGLSASLGDLLPGKQASFVVLDAGLAVIQTWIAGQCVYNAQSGE
jgi:N-acetylglucosamine-6-phosphate deacetylase